MCWLIDIKVSVNVGDSQQFRIFNQTHLSLNHEGKAQKTDNSDSIQ